MTSIGGTKAIVVPPGTLIVLSVSALDLVHSSQ